MLQAELVPRIHPFCRAAATDSSSSDLHSGNMISAPVSYLLTDLSAMTGFRPDSFRCFGTVLCAQLRSSGFPFLLRRGPSDGAPATVHRMASIRLYRHETVSVFVIIHGMTIFCKGRMKITLRTGTAPRRPRAAAPEARRSRSRRRRRCRSALKARRSRRRPRQDGRRTCRRRSCHARSLGCAL